jgi:hypothetical protein
VSASDWHWFSGCSYGECDGCGQPLWQDNARLVTVRDRSYHIGCLVIRADDQGIPEKSAAADAVFPVAVRRPYRTCAASRLARQLRARHLTVRGTFDYRKE